MAQVTVMIDGKAYRMACEAGQEEHLTDLATRFDRYVGHLKSQFGEIGDLRLTVMSGIMVMDELSELNRKIEKLEGRLLPFPVIVMAWPSIRRNRTRWSPSPSVILPTA